MPITQSISIRFGTTLPETRSPSNKQSLMFYQQGVGLFICLTANNWTKLFDENDSIIAGIEWGNIEGTITDQTDLINLLNLKAALVSPAFFGTPTAPTAAPGTNTTQLATTAFVKAAINALLGDVPAALDTLNELAAALGDDANFAATVTTALATKIHSAIGSPTVASAVWIGTQAEFDLIARDANTVYLISE